MTVLPSAFPAFFNFLTSPTTVSHSDGGMFAFESATLSKQIWYHVGWTIPSLSKYSLYIAGPYAFLISVDGAGGGGSTVSVSDFLHHFWTSESCAAFNDFEASIPYFTMESVGA